MSFVYGMLEVISNPHSDGESTEKKLKFTFNPTKLEMKASAKWEQPAAGGNKKASTPQFKGADPRELSMDVLLDAWELSGASRGDARDVEKDVATLVSWTRPTASSRNTKKPSPPLVALHWGKVWFTCYVSAVAVSFTMFDDKGTPMRALCKVTLKEAPAPAQGQNPTSGSRAGHQSHLVVQGDSLPLLAHRYYDKPAYWRAIAIANGIDDPLRIRPGDRLYLPPLEDVAGLLS